jgi:isochorismate synthase
MSLPDPTGLRAVSLPVDRGRVSLAGLLATAGTSGALVAADRLTLASVGTAAVLDLPGGLADGRGRAAVQAWLSAIPHAGAGTDDRVVAVGALPFDRSAPGALVVPVLTIRVDGDGGARATLVATTDDEKVLHAELANLLGLARDVEDRLAERDDEPSPALVEVPTGAAYADAVAVAVAAIAAGRLDKVVLARSVEARFPAPPDLGRVVGRLRRQEPSCTTFSLPVPGGRFVGATPELLVRRRQPTVTCHPLAGTVGLSGDAGGDAETVRQLLASAKDRREHRLVVDDIAAVLGPRCAELRVPDEPSLVRFRSVAHLGTAIQGTLLDDEPVLDLLAALHPTPAVGGVPLDAALAAITTLETTRRGYWAGPVGWVDAAGDGEWMIGLRSATVHGRLARLHAGAGIVAGSDPAAELAETTVKLAPVLDALAPGTSGRL